MIRKHEIEISIPVRGCTGFDGDFEIMEAIRRPGLRTNLDLNINAEDNFALAA